MISMLRICIGFAENILSNFSSSYDDRADNLSGTSQAKTNGSAVGLLLSKGEVDRNMNAGLRFADFKQYVVNGGLLIFASLLKISFLLSKAKLLLNVPNKVLLRREHI
uniref:Uncharacterized protein n=1 Tax=Glossina palpalis gambiensis TaxID=67801 RepID=A0A1B0AZC3_9MUSC